MNLPCRWGILLISLWIQVDFVPGIHCKDETVNHLSREDVLLLKDEEDPKCFTRTEQDFTCFFESADNRTYDLFYEVKGKKRCEMSVQGTEEGTFLHICSFPASDIHFFVAIHLEVVERNSSTGLYKRTISPEDHFLLDPPFGVSLQQNDQAGQLRVSWHPTILKYWASFLRYRIRYSSKGLGEKIKETKKGVVLDSLVPGEEVQVQVAVKCAQEEDVGHWSRWSRLVRAVVPQNADDISLLCYTTDLQSIICQWNRSRYGVKTEYKLYYKMNLSEGFAWTEWTECLHRDSTDRCHFRGDQSRKVRVKLNSTPGPLSRTFYTEEFTLNKNIKTSPPSHLKGVLEKDKLCLQWESPLPFLSAHLQYEVSYQIRGEGKWMTVSLKGPQTHTCLDVLTDSQYSVKFRAKPFGSVYSGHWSDWSDVLTGDTPTDRGILLMLCIPVVMLITAIVLISFFMHLSKLKLYFWPPVPNLDKVLQGFLTEMNGQRWNPPIAAKQCSEEIIASVVEIMSKDEVSGSGKPSEESNQLLSADRSFSSREQLDGSPETEVFPDYVTLNKNSVIICQKGNNYVDKQAGEKEGPTVKNELFQTCHSSRTDGSVCTPSCLSSDFLNHSYLPLAEPADKFDCKVAAPRGPGNLYTNFPCG